MGSGPSKSGVPLILHGHKGRTLHHLALIITLLFTHNFQPKHVMVICVTHLIHKMAAGIG